MPIPDTTSIEHLREDLAAANLNPDRALIARLDALINWDSVSGERYAPTTQAEIDTEQRA